jgi:hypothetical protein
METENGNEKWNKWKWTMEIQLEARLTNAPSWSADALSSLGAYFLIGYRRTSISGTNFSGKKCLSGTISMLFD